MTDSNLPRHVGIIMDGNGRWAKKRNQPRTAGHREGLKAAKAVVKSAHDLGIRYLSLYTFSTENWKRTEEEVSFLMKLIKNNLRREYDFYVENNIRVVHSGDLNAIPEDIREEIRIVEEETASFDSTTVNLAINYGGRDEIVRAIRKGLETGADIADISEEMIQHNLDRSEIPDLDLIIRTGGEQRLSNFMLWRSSYAELYFSDSLWPDFGGDEFGQIINWFLMRNRRFGGL